jgi:putative PIN family toxin of toxin-antitoxin system
VSAARNPGGVTRRAIAIAHSRGAIAFSGAVYQAIAGVLARGKFARVLTRDRRDEALEPLSAAALGIEQAVTVRGCRDAKDNRYLELALAASAEAIVSGDDDLLVLHPWRGIAVLRPAAFLAKLEHA